MDLLVYFLVIILVGCFLILHGLDYNHNKGRIYLKNIKKPNHDNYLVGMYIGYLKHIKSGNVLLERIDDTFIFHIENNEKVIDYLVKKEDIIKSEVKIKSFHTQGNVIKNHGIDDSRSYFAGTPVGDAEQTVWGKEIKIRKSYFVELLLNNNTKLEVIFFNDPNFLLNVK